MIYSSPQTARSITRALNRAAKKAGVGQKIKEYQVVYCCRATGWACQRCGQGNHPTARLCGWHCWPVQIGGNRPENVRILCPNCVEALARYRAERLHATAAA